MERQKAAVRDHRAMTFAECRELWKERRHSMHQAHELAAGTTIGRLYPPETAVPNLSRAFVIVQILQRERGQRRRRIPHRGPLKDWLPPTRVSLPRKYFRRRHPTRPVRFLSTPSARAGLLAHSGPTHAGPAI